MALPVFQAKGALVSGTAGTLSPAWPVAAHQAGDIGLLLVETCGGEPASLTTPNGFVAVPNSPQATGATTNGTALAVYWCRATSGTMPAPVVADSGNHTEAIIITFRGCVASGNPWDVTSGSVKAAASTSITFPGVTTSANDCLIVNIAARDTDSAGAAFSAESNGSLSGLTERVDEGTTQGNGGGFGVYAGGLALLGSSGSTSATVASSINAMLTIALLPETFVSTGWQPALTLTVDDARVDADLTDFPVYVNLAHMPAGFWSGVQADGGDIRVTTPSGIQCPVEVVAIDGGTDTGELHFKAPSLANSSDTAFSVYYGHATAEQPGATAPHGSQAVWRSEYKGVWHLGSSLNDSTGNANNGTNDSTSQVAGKLGDGRDFESGSSAYVSVPDATSLDISTPLSVEAWFQLESLPADNSEYQMVGKDNATRGFAFGILTQGGATSARFNVGDGSYPEGSGTVFGNTALSTGIWYHAVGVYDGGAGTKFTLYVNGSISDTQANGPTSINNTDATLQIGARERSGERNFFDGLLDEVRVANVAHSGTWISTQYNNHSSPSTFYTVSSPSTPVTVTPSALTVAASLPAPTVRRGVTVSPAALSLSASQPVPAVRLPKTVAVAAQSLASAMQTPTLSGKANVAPSALALAAAGQPPAVRATANVAPAALSLASAAQVPTVRVHKTVAVSALSLASSLPASAVVANAIVAPAAQALASSLATPQPRFPRTVSPAALTLQGATQTPAVIGKAVVTPSALSLASSQPAPSLLLPRTVFPSALSLAASLPAPVPSGKANVSPAALSLASSLRAPTVRVHKTVQVGSLTVVSSLPSSALSTQATVTPSPLTLAASAQSPAVRLPRTVSPSAIPFASSVLAPTVSAVKNVTASPAALALASTLPAPTVSSAGGVTVTPVALTLATSLPVPTPSTGVRVVPTAITLSASQQAQTVSGSVRVSLVALSLSAAVQTPAVTCPRTVAPEPATLTATVLAPSTNQCVLVQPGTISVAASVETPVVVTYAPALVSVGPLAVGATVQEPLVRVQVVRIVGQKSWDALLVTRREARLTDRLPDDGPEPHGTLTEGWSRKRSGLS